MPELFKISAPKNFRLSVGEDKSNEQAAATRTLEPVVTINAQTCYQHCLGEMGPTLAFYFNLYSDADFNYCSCCPNPPSTFIPSLGAVAYMACLSIQLKSYITHPNGKKMTSSSAVRPGALLKVVVEISLPTRSVK